MNNDQIVSPCISVCKTDPVSGYCYGCGRDNEDKNCGKTQILQTSGKFKT